MSNKNSNYPNNALNKLDGTVFVGKTVSCLMELSHKGIPKDVAELENRITEYFTFCCENDFRPGIESLSLALGTSRQNFWLWCSGKTRDVEWAEICIRARQTIIAFIESASLSGKLNPATSCFLLKNWSGYSDTMSIEAVTAPDTMFTYRSFDDLPMFNDSDDESESD